MGGQRWRLRSDRKELGRRVRSDSRRSRLSTHKLRHRGVAPSKGAAIPHAGHPGRGLPAIDQHRWRRGLKRGWPTDQATKPILVDDLAAAISQGAVLIRSRALIDELMTFIVTDTGSQEAQAGCHDDRVMALDIAWQVRKRPVARGTTQQPAGW